ncbi:MAG: hypothetical protein AAGN35_17310 [Bacteroidota bacterium]
MNQDNYHIDQIFSVPDGISADQFLKYANDELSEQEAHEVERLLADSDFHTDALEGIEMVGSAQFEAMMAKANAAIDAKVAAGHEADAKVISLRSEPETAPAATTPTPSRKLFRYLSVAASVVLLAVAGFIFLRSPLTPQSVAQEYFEVFDGNVVRGGLHSTTNIYDTAKQLYNDKKYSEAAPLFDEVDSIQSLYYAANSYYEIGQYDLAADRFRSVIAKGDGYAEDAEFGLAMTLLMQENVADARNLLNDMAQDERHNYTAKAREVLQKIESL